MRLSSVSLGTNALAELQSLRHRDTRSPVPGSEADCEPRKELKAMTDRISARVVGALFMVATLAGDRRFDQSKQPVH